jgi:hypothetical protein
VSTIKDLLNRTRIRADAVGNDFFDDSEIINYINIGLGELYDILILKFEDYFISSSTLTLVKGQSEYSFDSEIWGDSGAKLTDLYKCVGVDADESGEAIRLRRFSLRDRAKYSSQSIVGRGTSTNYQYQIRDRSLAFIPKPSTTASITLWYIPAFVPLGAKVVGSGEDATEVADELNATIMSHWAEYAVVTAVAKMKEKEELSTTVIGEELKGIRMRIEDASANRDAGESMEITDEHTGAWGLLHGAS